MFGSRRREANDAPILSDDEKNMKRGVLRGKIKMRNDERAELKREIQELEGELENV